MKILSIEIVEFGGLKNKKFTLDEGINLFYGENESGKSTVHLFIKFMLYGLNTKKSGGIYERERMLSWDGGAAVGSMDFEREGKRFRIARSRIGRRDELHVTDLDVSLPLTLFVSPGEYFLGIDAETYDSTCSVGQFRTNSIDSEKTGNAIDNILSTADENIDTAKIAAEFKKIKSTYTQPQKQEGALDRLSRKKAELELELETARENHKELRKHYLAQIENKAKIADAAEKRRHADEIFVEAEKIRTLREFDLLNEKRAERVRFVAEKDELEKTSFPNAFIPAATDLAELQSAKQGVVSAAESLANSERELGLFLAENVIDREKVKLAKRIEEKGAELLKVKAVGYKKNKSIFGILCIVMSVLFLAAAGFTVWNIIGETNLVMPLIAACVFALMFAAFFIFISSVNAKNLKMLLSQFDAKYENFVPLIDDCVLYLANAKRTETEADKKRAKIEYETEILNKAKNKLSESLMRFTSEKKKDDPLQVCLETEGKCTEFLKNLAELKHNISSTDMFIKEKAESLAGKNEEKLRAGLRADMAVITEESLAEAEKSKKFYDNQYEVLAKFGNEISQNIARVEANIRNPLHIEAELDKINLSLAVETEKFETLQKAQETIEAAAEAMRNLVTPKIRLRANEIIEKLSGGRYSEIGLHKDFRPEVGIGSATKYAEALSGGTRDAVYLSLRLAVLEVLMGEVKTTLMLDESLSQLDDNRAAKLLDFISAYASRDGGQCLMFTCHKREAELLKAMNYVFKEIVL